MHAALRPAISTVIAALFLAPLPATAERTNGPWVDLPVCTEPGFRGGADIISDGQQGAIVAWQETRSPSVDNDIYVQRLNAAGRRMWPVEGVLLSRAIGDQSTVKLASDGEGGAYAAWIDYLSGRLAVQRIRADGSVAWAENGIPASIAYPGGYPRIQADGRGRALLTWESIEVNQRILIAQLINQQGTRLWGDSGIVAARVVFSLYGPGPSIASDGNGGAFLAWTDKSNDAWRAVAQHLSPDGKTTWPEGGVALCPAPSDQRYCVLVGDGAGHAIVAWKDSRSPRVETFGLFAQRIDAAGRLTWNPDGVRLDSRAESDDLFPEMTANGNGAIVAWHDRRSGDYDIYAQSVGGAGDLRWGAEAPAVCRATGDQVYPSVALTGHDQVAFAWDDGRTSELSVFAQLLDRAGRPELTEGGMFVGANLATANSAIAGDGRSGAFAVRSDPRGWPGQVDLYARHFVDHAPQGLAAGREVRPSRALSWNAESRTLTVDLPEKGPLNVSIFDVLGRSCATLENATGAGAVRWDGKDRAGLAMAPGIYFVRATRGAREAHLRILLLP